MHKINTISIRFSDASVNYNAGFLASGHNVTIDDFCEVVAASLFFGPGVEVLDSGDGKPVCFKTYGKKIVFTKSDYLYFCGILEVISSLFKGKPDTYYFLRVLRNGRVPVPTHFNIGSTKKRAMQIFLLAKDLERSYHSNRVELWQKDSDGERRIE